MTTASTSLNPRYRLEDIVAACIPHFDPESLHVKRTVFAHRNWRYQLTRIMDEGSNGPHIEVERMRIACPKTVHYGDYIIEHCSLTPKIGTLHDAGFVDGYFVTFSMRVKQANACLFCRGVVCSDALDDDTTLWLWDRHLGTPRHTTNFAATVRELSASWGLPEDAVRLVFEFVMGSG